MKRMTLQQEIVEALRIGATRCEDLRDSWESEYTDAHLDDEADKLRQLAALVENARCEKCECRESDIGLCGEIEIVVRNGFGCWNHMEKVNK